MSITKLHSNLNVSKIFTTSALQSLNFEAESQP